MSDTDAAAIAALLEELREVDFEAWKDVKFLLSNFMLWPKPRDMPLEQNAYSDIIQGCIQRAIVSKGGDWRVESWNSPKGLFHRAEIIGWKGGEYKQDASTPAAAILAAYTKAVRAME